MREEGNRVVQQTKLIYGLTQAHVDKLNEAGFVIAPREPTETMVEAAWASATAEDAAGVWRDMIEAIDGQQGIEK